MGIGKKNREKLGKVLTQCKSGLITPSRVVEILKISKIQATSLLQQWKKSGWLCRIRRGLYQPLPLETDTLQSAIEDPWIVANKIFSPCYIGGWSAIEFWGLTEQIFTTVIVVTSHRLSKKDFQINDITYRLKMTSNKNLFGLKQIWRNNTKVQVSDPSKTIVDLLNDPVLGGGMRSVTDFFKEYLKSTEKDFSLLLQYSEQINNRTIFKRLGFLLDFLLPKESNFIAECKNRISKGRSQFDPTVKGKKFIAKWSLLVPEAFLNLEQEALND